MSDADEEEDRSEMDVHEAAGVSDRIAWTLTTPGVGAAIQTIVHKPGFAISTKVDAAGKLDISANGDPPQNEAGSGSSTGILSSALGKRDQKVCGPILRWPIRDSDVDCYCQRGETLYFQITRIEREIWPLMAKGEVVKKDAGNSVEPTKAVYDAFHKKNIKARKQNDIPREKIILGLAADVTPRYATPAVADEVRRRYGREIAASGFKEVWIIGPAPGDCYRLDC